MNVVPKLKYYLKYVGIKFSLIEFLFFGYL